MSILPAVTTDTTPNPDNPPPELPNDAAEGDLVPVVRMRSDGSGPLVAFLYLKHGSDWVYVA